MDYQAAYDVTAVLLLNKFSAILNPCIASALPLPLHVFFILFWPVQKTADVRVNSTFAQ